MTKDEKIELLLQEINTLKKRVDNLTDFSLVTDNNIKTIHENIKILNKKLELQSELIRLTRKQLDLLAGVEEKNMNNKNMFENCRFFRTDVPITNRHADHNVRRWNWIDNEGRGRTYGEINSPDSFYRQCIVRQDYGGNAASIYQDLNYDLSSGMICAEEIT